MKKILSIAISKSNFYKDTIKIDFSGKLNCIMGGRGTGKSTLLHFMIACLTQDAEDNKVTYNILKNNLGTGVITLFIQDDEGKKYKIVKSIDELPQCYSLPGEKVVSFKSIKNSLLCDFYKSQSIEDIGKNPLDRLELIDKMILEERALIVDEMDEIKMGLEENAQSIKTENQRIKQFNQSLQQFEGVEEEFAKIQEDKPDDIDKKEEKDFETADKNEKIRSSEKRYLLAVNESLVDFADLIEGASEELKDTGNAGFKIDTFLNKEIILNIDNEYKAAIKKVEKLLNEATQIIGTTQLKIEGYESKLEKIHLMQQNEFVKLKQKMEKHKSYYNKWNDLSKKVDEKNATLEKRKKIIEKRGKIKKQRQELLQKLIGKTKQLFDLRKAKVDAINKQFSGSVKVTLTYGGITEDYEEALRNALRGSNMKYNTLISAIVDNFPPHKFAEIIHKKDLETLKRITGIDKERGTAIITALHESEAIYELETISCPDYPEFLLKVDEKNNPDAKNKDNYKKSEDLSTGQRCTTVLPIVFAVSENPLLIDQPEDNLDNRYISETIHKIIREQKEKRQLVFITHNPNIPVLSDAEINYFLNYDNKKSSIENRGGILDVKTNILNLMEGGKEAFKKREELYGEELND